MYVANHLSSEELKGLAKQQTQYDYLYVIGAVCLLAMDGKGTASSVS